MNFFGFFESILGPEENRVSWQVLHVAFYSFTCDLRDSVGVSVGASVGLSDSSNSIIRDHRKIPFRLLSLPIGERFVQVAYPKSSGPRKPEKRQHLPRPRGTGWQRTQLIQNKSNTYSHGEKQPGVGAPNCEERRGQYPGTHTVFPEGASSEFVKCQGPSKMVKSIATYETDEDTVCSEDDKDEPNESVDIETNTDNPSRYTSRPPPAKVASHQQRAPSQRKK